MIIFINNNYKNSSSQQEHKGAKEELAAELDMRIGQDRGAEGGTAGQQQSWRRGAVATSNLMMPRLRTEADIRPETLRRKVEMGRGNKKGSTSFDAVSFRDSGNDQVEEETKKEALQLIQHLFEP